jgi:hypothetical protein
VPRAHVIGEEGRPVEKAAEPPEPVEIPDARDPMSAFGLLALQQSAGNVAVQRAILARNGGGATATAAPTGAKTPDQAFADALAAKDWDKLAVILNSVFSWSDAGDKIDTLDADQCRWLDDAARRVLPAAAAARIAIFARSRLGDLGVDEAHQAPGAGYGEMEMEVISVTDGVVGTKSYEYSMKIKFKPEVAAVKADSIAFIQRVRLVDTKTGANKDWDQVNRERATTRQSSIDRIPGKDQGWYGVANDLTDQGNLQTWVRGGTKTEAFMTDAPGAAIPDTTWEFETAAVSRSGPDTGTVYGVITWGFTVDDKLKVTGMPNLTFNKPTSDFSAAIATWNKQAKGPAAKRTSPNQAELPAVQ